MLEDSCCITNSRNHLSERLGKRRHPSTCMGCGQEIFDQFILRVSPDLEWHAACLKCVECQQFLDENCTCFVRDAKTYCKRDYLRLFGSKCAKCQLCFSKNDYVMRARNQIYHVDCFHCVACRTLLRPGQEFVLRPDGLYCKSDHEITEKSALNTSLDSLGPHDDHLVLDDDPATPTNHPSSSTPVPPMGTSLPRDQMSSAGSNCSSGSGTVENGRSGGGLEGGGKKKKDQKTTRVRTVLNEKQLHTLRTCYNANPRPDALMKEQLVEMTGLSPRVIRVWFQNKRCKDKKRQILMKQMQQQQEKNQVLNGIRMHGVGPLSATSPIRHEMPLIQALDVRQYQQSPSVWKMTDYGDSEPSYHRLLTGYEDGSHLSFMPGQLIDQPILEMGHISPALGGSELSSPTCSD